MKTMKRLLLLGWMGAAAALGQNTGNWAVDYANTANVPDGAVLTLQYNPGGGLTQYHATWSGLIAEINEDLRLHAVPKTDDLDLEGNNLLMSGANILLGGGDINLAGALIAGNGADPNEGITLTPEGTGNVQVSSDLYLGGATTNLSLSASVLRLRSSTTNLFAFDSELLKLQSDGEVRWTNSATDATGTADATLLRAASGVVAIGGRAAANGALQLTEDTDLGTNYARFSLPAGGLAANTAYTLPPDDGDAGEQLQTDGSGVLTWESAGAGGGGGVVADTDLAGGTALSVNTGYFDTFSANRTFAALPAGVDGDRILLVFDVTGAARDLDFHTNSTVLRTGDDGALAAALTFQVGYHQLILEKADGRWQLTDSAVDSEAANLVYASPDGSAGVPSFRAISVEDLANGTDGELITWDAAGDPTTVATGTAGHVLTSNGAGAAPTFQAAAAGGPTLLVNKTLDANATTTPADITELTFSASANTNYLLVFDLLIDVVGGGGSVGIGVDVPAGATLTGMSFTHAGTQVHSADDTPIASGGVDVLLHGSVYVDLAGTAGTVALRFEEINAATTVNINVGSWLEYSVVP
jgi:hypothetical protein